MSVWSEADDLLEGPPAAPAGSSSVWDEADQLLAQPKKPAPVSPSTSDVWTQADQLLNAPVVKPTRPPVFAAAGITDPTSVKVDSAPTWDALRAQFQQEPRLSVGDATLDDALRRQAPDSELEAIGRGRALMQPTAATLPKPPSPDALARAARSRALITSTHGGEAVIGDTPPLGAVPVLDAPAVGVPRVIAGTRAMIPATAGGTGKTSADMLHGGNELLEGLMQTAEPVIAAGAITNPVATAGGLLRAFLVQKVGEAVAEQLGASPEAQRLVGNLAAVLSGGLSADELARKSLEDAKSLGRKVTLASKLSGSGFGTGDVPGFRSNPVVDELTMRGSEAVDTRGAADFGFTQGEKTPVTPEVVQAIDEVLGERPETAQPAAEVSQNVPRETPAEPGAASIPFMITKAMEAELKARGLSDADISKLSPAAAHEILTAPPAPSPDQVPPGEEAPYNATRQPEGQPPAPAPVVPQTAAEAVRAAYKADPVAEREAADDARRRADEARASVDPALVNEIDQVLGTTGQSDQQPLPAQASGAVSTDASTTAGFAHSNEGEKQEVPAVTATFLGYQPTGDGDAATPLYNIAGGPRDRSTVSPATLEELGIAIPPTPSLEQFQAARSAGTWRPGQPWTGPTAPATGETSGASLARDIDAVLNEKPAIHKFASTQIDLPADVGAALHKVAAGIPAEHLAADGREETPHVTVKYGLHETDPAAVARVLAGEGPVTVRLGKTSIFPNGESNSGDVVKVDIDSPDLHRLNAKIAALPHTDTHPDYKPHATLAYVKPGLGARYAGNAALEGQTATVDRIVLTGHHGERIEIPLRGAGARMEATDATAEAPAGPGAPHGATERLSTEGGGGAASEGREAGAQAAPAPTETPKQRAARERKERRARRQQERADYRAAVDADHEALIDKTINKAVADGYTGDRETLRAVILDRVQLIRSFDADVAESDRNPRRLLEEIARLGGIGIKAEAGSTAGLKAGRGEQGEIRWFQTFAKMNATKTAGAMAGVHGVFSEGPRALSLDGVLEGLKQDGGFTHIETINDLLEELREAAKLSEKDEHDLALERAIDMLESSGYWWAESPVVDEPRDSVEPEPGDYDPADLTFDLRDLEAEGLDVLDTGEVQPHLPGAGDVRKADIETPEVAEAVFSLDPKAADETATDQGGLFEGGEFTAEQLAAQAKKKGTAKARRPGDEGPLFSDKARGGRRRGNLDAILPAKQQTASVAELAALHEGQTLEQYVKEDRPESFPALLEDIRKNGITTPIMVRLGRDGKPDVIVDGRHRLRAAQVLGLERVPIREGRAPAFSEILGAMKKADGGTTLNMELVPGASQFLERDVLPALVRAGDEVRGLEASVRAVWAPDQISGASRTQGAIMRSNLALRRQRTAKARRAMRQLEQAFDKMPESFNREFALAVDEGRYDDLEQMTGLLITEKGTGQRVSISLRQLAEMFQTVNTAKREEVLSLKGSVGYIRNYFPREFVRPGRVRAFIERQLFRRRPIQGAAGFKKRRHRDETGNVIPLRKYLERGYNLVDYNPVRAHLRKWLEMDKWIAARRILLEGKGAKTTHYFSVEDEARAHRAGLVKYDESFGTVYGPPVVTLYEFYDELLMSELTAFAEGLGIDVQRKLHFNRRGMGEHPPSVMGYAQSNVGTYKQGQGPLERQEGTSPGRVVTRFAGDLGTLMHEIGHILQDTYGLWDRIVEPAPRETRTLTKGKDKGKVVTRAAKQDKATVARRQRIKEQLRKLADARAGVTKADGQWAPTFPGGTDYLRSMPEQMANVVEAFISFPETMKDVAPDAYWAMFNAVKEHPELSGLIGLQRARSASRTMGMASERLEGKLIKGYYWGPPEAVRLLNNHLSPGLGANKALNLYRKAGNLLNQVQLGLSGFHLVGTAMNSGISRGALALEHASRGQFLKAAKAAAETPIAPLLDVIRGHRALNHYYETDVHFRGVIDEAGLIVRAGGGVGWDDFWHSSAPERFMEAIHGTIAEAKAGNYPGAAARAALVAWRAFPALVELQAKPVMEWWVPRLKLAAFLDLARLELPDLGEKPDELELRTVLGDAWDSVDNRFGELVYDNLFWNRILKDAGMASVRALGWNVGTVREVGGAPLAQLRSLLKPNQRLRYAGEKPVETEGGGARGPDGEELTEPDYRLGREPWLTHKGAYFLSLVFLSAMFGALYQKFHTGLNPGELEDGDFDPSVALLDLYFPRTGGVTVDGRPERASLPTYIKDVYAFSQHPWTTTVHKLHPLLSLAAQIWQNEDYYGNAIRDDEDPALRQALDLVRYMERQYRPISVQSYFERQQNKTGGAISAVESFFGINVAPASVTRTKLEEYLHEVSPPMHRTRDQAAAAAVSREVRRDLETHNVPAARQAAQAGKMTERQGQAAERGAQMSGIQRAFSHLTLKQGLHAYELATPHERATLAPALERKADNADIPADEVQELRDKLRAAMALPRTKAKPRLEDVLRPR